MLKNFFVIAALCGFFYSAHAQENPTGAMPLPNITIYHLEGRRSERIVWMMEELELPYELVYTRGDLRASMASIKALGHEMPMAPTSAGRRCRSEESQLEPTYCVGITF